MATLARQPPATHPSVAYRRILVPLWPETAPGAVVTACFLAAEHGGTVSALVVIEVPAALPLDAHMQKEELEARRMLAAAEATGDRYGVRVDWRLVRARLAREAVVQAAEDSDAQLIVLRRPLDRTARYVLKNARCRVLFSRPAP